MDLGESSNASLTANPELIKLQSSGVPADNLLHDSTAKELQVDSLAASDDAVEADNLMATHINTVTSVVIVEKSGLTLD